jgi:hypothetical protein
LTWEDDAEIWVHKDLERSGRGIFQAEIFLIRLRKTTKELMKMAASGVEIQAEFVLKTATAARFILPSKDTHL